MWPDSKGKGGKDGASKSKDGGGEEKKTGAAASGAPSGGKSGGKNRNTKTKMKALAAEAAAQTAAEASAKLEQDILKAAQNMGGSSGQSEETKTLIEVNRVPDSMVRNTSLPAMPQPQPTSVPQYQGQAPQTGPADGNLMRLPTGTTDMDEKISSLWKNKVLGAYRANPRASQHILPAMPNNRGALEITEKARAEAQHTAMVQLVDKMFDRFQNLAFEFNESATPDLELTWIRPILSRENISSWHQAAQIVSVFTGRISTRHWTMVVRGTPDSVLSYCIPADKLLTFSNQPANFQPVIELVPMADGLTVRWSLLGRVVSAEDLHHVYRALLDNMIRIAQDDAPSDRFIDLAAYGVYLQGEPMPEGAAPPPPKQVMGNDIDYTAKYQQQFGRAPTPPVGMQTPSMPVSQSQAPSAPQFVDDGSSADWKPVVHAVRGANPPVPASPMPGQMPPQGMPTTPGFNQDEPWKVGVPSQAGGQTVNPFAGGGGGNFGQFVPGDQTDEPPLPALPAHLFEGLPPRPQTGQNLNQSVSQSLSQQISQQSGVGGGWSSPTSVPNPASMSPPASPASFANDDDGWKSADIPATKGMSGLPPLPVSNAGSSSGVSFDSVSSPQSVNRSFTSGSIRLDAIAREISQSPMDLPPAVPGFEPYSVDQGKPGRGDSANFAMPTMPNPFAPAAPPPPEPQGETSYDEEEEDDDDDDRNRLPWPTARPRTVENDVAEPSGEVNTAAQAAFPYVAERVPQSPPSFSPSFTPASAPPGGSPGGELEDTQEDPEQNAFITHDGDNSLAAVRPEMVNAPEPTPHARFEPVPNQPELDDPEIVALFEGEPVNAPAKFEALEPPKLPDPPKLQEPPKPTLIGADSGFMDWSTESENLESGSFHQVVLPPADTLSEPPAEPPAPPEAQSAWGAPPEKAFQTGEYSRANIEAGFRMAQEAAAAAAAQAAANDATLEVEPVNDNTLEIGVVDQVATSDAPSAPGNYVAPQWGSPPPAVAQPTALSINADISKLLANLDIELENISNRGSEAFAKRDLKGAERMIKLAEKLSEFKESLVKLQEEHGSDLS